MSHDNDTSSRLRAELLETTEEMHKLGIMDKAGLDKITMRHLGQRSDAASPTPMTPADIRMLREQANMSQAVFARSVGVTPNYVSALERGQKHPSGPVLVLLNAIKRRGIDIVLA